jgi:hypothetical protein
LIPLVTRDVNGSVSKAEIIKKQKKDLLHASVVAQMQEGCTFAPKFVSKPTLRNKVSESSDKPVSE